MTVSGSVRLALMHEAPAAADRVLTAEALEFVARLHREFNPARMALLARRVERQRSIDAGVLPDFLAETARVRETEWRVAPAPHDLDDRRVEITGPVERKMMINALNSGAKIFMADFEDALSPTWSNVVDGQANLIDAIRRTLEFTSPEGKAYRLNERTATLVVRPRGWHLPEKHVQVDGAPVSASLFDFGLYLFHNARALRERGSGPYFYLPKLESHLEARLWNDVFGFAQDALSIPRGTIRATVLIETILAAFEMDEILYELRDHAAGLNAGRWDYIFSAIKKLRNHPEMVLPDRSQVTMTVPFMRAYAELLVKTCHRRGAHAMGGMAAFIPSRRDAEVNAKAIAKVREDKQRESREGFDGTWVAHPDLVGVAMEEFDRTLGDRPHQKDRLPSEVTPTASDLLDVRVPGGTVSLAGVRNNISVSLQYIGAWLRGSGAVAIYNLMEDAATAEISRAQLWQWIRHEVSLVDASGSTPGSGVRMTRELYAELRERELANVESMPGMEGGAYRDAARLLDALVLDEKFTEFLTIPGYEYLD
ncbi:MAG: malate synthase A [Gemmatimonadota bacterium]|nr:malate synthase A [Gemmatimonadota bacterium]